MLDEIDVRGKILSLKKRGYSTEGLAQDDLTRLRCLNQCSDTGVFDIRLLKDQAAYDSMTIEQLKSQYKLVQKDMDQWQDKMCQNLQAVSFFEGVKFGKKVKKNAVAGDGSPG